MILLLSIACTREVLDFEATCATLWPEDTCAERCGATDLERRWVDAFPRAFALETGLSEGQVAGLARVRSIRGGPTFTSLTSVSYQFDYDWVRVVREVELSTDGDDSDDALVAAWRERLNAPSIDLDGRASSYADVRDFLAECEETHGVELGDEAWCDPYVTTDPDDDDPQSLRFDFTSATTSYAYVLASVDVTGNAEWRCEEQQITISR